MAKYIKHNSNYIKTSRHQFLKGGSTIFERDWVTIGSQLNFGPGKIPYYNNGNFIFTTSPIPYYQKKFKNGVIVAVWTYEDVKDSTPIVNEINFDEYTEDIRSYAYYGSCMELVRTSVENIIRTFPGMIVKDDNQIEYLNKEQTAYEESGYYPLQNDFGIDLVNEVVKENENEMRFLMVSKDKYLVNGEEIKEYNVLRRRMVLSTNDTCISNRKKAKNTSFKFFNESQYKERWINQELSEHPEKTRQEIEAEFDINTSKLNYAPKVELTLNYNEGGNYTSQYTGCCYFQFGFNSDANNKKSLAYSHDLIDFLNTHDGTPTQDFKIPSTVNGSKVTISYDYSTNQLTVSCPRAGYSQSFNIPITDAIGNTLKFVFYNEYTLLLKYCYLQNVTEDEYNDNYQSKYKDWDYTKCPFDNWTENTSFKKECDGYWDFTKHDWQYILYSEQSDINNWNRPVYVINITTESNTYTIVAYILEGRLVFMTKHDGDLIIRPKEEIIEEYFNNLKGFEKQLLIRKTNPLYTNTFVTPFEYNLTYLYYKRQYTWPSTYDYCIDISSSRYIDFLNSLTNIAQLYDELWTDNLWRRMTHEAIKNYDWTYTREFNPGDEEDNVEGGERMHKVLNIIGRVFDDIKLRIDTIKRFNRSTYDGDRNMPNALLSDKLELNGWDIYSTIPSYEITEDSEIKIVSASDVPIGENISDITNTTYSNQWYPTSNPNKITFADVDNEFMRRLLLSTRRIFMTKGTRQSIDMIMGIFGYGDTDYEITEEYRTVTPKDYDDTASGDDETFGDKIVRLNMSKENRLLYDDDASGIPVGSFAVSEKRTEGQEEIMETKTYLIPFYNQTKIYDGNFYFQSKGGWFYNKENDSDNEDDIFKWTETMSYLHVASQVKDLLYVNPNSINNGDIYYVVNINDYIDFTEEEPKSNFFVLEDDLNSDKFESWTNLDLSGQRYTTANNYSDEAIAKYKYYVQKAIYLDSIIPYNIGNNPHVGYGYYDKGNEYYEYMSTPFKYSIDTNNFDTIEHKQEAENITFTLSEEISARNNTDKVQIFADSSDDGLDKEENIFTDGKGNLNYTSYKLDKIKEKSKREYYLNDKVIHFKNKLNNNQYKRYFKTVIMKYLMQIVPSTSIFILEDFEETE